MRNTKTTMTLTKEKTSRHQMSKNNGNPRMKDKGIFTGKFSKYQAILFLILSVSCSANNMKTSDAEKKDSGNPAKLLDFDITATDYLGMKASSFSANWTAVLVPDEVLLSNAKQLSPEEKARTFMLEKDLDFDGQLETVIAGLFKKNSGEKGRFLAVFRKFDRKIILCWDYAIDNSFISLEYYKDENSVIVIDKLNSESHQKVQFSEGCISLVDIPAID